ncbi:MAG: hypothetical protein ACTHNS_05705 [Marmoricola sp.]
MQKWEDVEDVEALRETAAKLGVQGTDTMDRGQLIEALNTADVSDAAQGNDQARADAESAFGSESS